MQRSDGRTLCTTFQSRKGSAPTFVKAWWNLSETLVEPWKNLPQNLLVAQDKPSWQPKTHPPQRTRDTTKLGESWWNLPRSTRGYSFFSYQAKAIYIYINKYIYIYINNHKHIYIYISLIQFTHSALHLILLFSSLAGNSSGLMLVILTNTNLYLRWQTIPI